MAFLLLVSLLMVMARLTMLPITSTFGNSKKIAKWWESSQCNKTEKN